jgi:thiamine pyrophosphokinase
MSASKRCNGIVRALIVLNGGLESPQQLQRWASGCDLLIAADGGANIVHKANLHADVVIGDMDSIEPPILASLRADQLLRDDLQDRTDFQKALNYAVRSGAAQIVILNSEGDRPDHFIAAIGWARAFAAELEIRFAMQKMIVHMATGETELKCPIGTTVSILPVPSCVVRETAGLRWPLTNRLLELGNLHSVSNVATGDPIRLSISEGCAAVFIHRFEGDIAW